MTPSARLNAIASGSGEKIHVPTPRVSGKLALLFQVIFTDNLCFSQRNQAEKGAPHAEDISSNKKQIQTVTIMTLVSDTILIFLCKLSTSSITIVVFYLYIF